MTTDDSPAAAPPPDQPPPSPDADAGKAGESTKPGDSGKKPADKTDAEDPHGADRRAFGEAYGRGIFRTDGPMAFLRDTKIQKQHIGDVYNIVESGAKAARSATVRDDYLTGIRASYVDVPRYERMYRALSEYRLLVLYGQPGTGRLTTALHLLDQVASGKVSRFDDELELKSLTKNDFDDGRGYVVSHDGTSLTETRLDKLRDLLVKRKCYCVVITEPDELRTGSTNRYAFEYEPPDSSALLERCIAREVRSGDRADAEELLTEQAASPELRAALGPRPRPVETAEMARLLAEFGRGEITLDAVETQAAQLVQRQVVEWFADLSASRSEERLKEALRLAAFRIALAVFNESPYHIVAKAGVDLADRFIAAVSTTAPTKERPSVFSDRQARMLSNSRAEIVDGHLAFGAFSIPVGLARFSDDRFPVVLLSYVWQEHHNLRAAMVAWLLKLSRDLRHTIWVRAAQATGLVCSLDFHFTYTKMIASAAAASGKKCLRRRMFAAVALDQAARDERITSAISDRLKYWRRHGSEAQKWTAAAAFGYDLGRLSIESTLEELRVLGTPTELQSAFDEASNRELVHICGYSLANLLAFGEVRSILEQLGDWIASSRQSVRELAWWAMVWLINLHGFDLTQPRRLAGRAERTLPQSREQWPLLLALQDENPELTQPIADLLWWLLRGRRADFVAKQLFGRWIRAAEKDPEALRALVQFVPHLIHDEGDANRLHYLIIRLRRDWCDPLDDEAASLLEAAIHPVASRKEAS